MARMATATWSSVLLPSVERVIDSSMRAAVSLADWALCCARLRTAVGHHGETQAHLTRAGHEAFRQALAQGLHATFVLGLGAVLLGLALVVLYMPGGSVLDLAPAEGIAGGGDGAGNGEAG